MHKVSSVGDELIFMRRLECLKILNTYDDALNARVLLTAMRQRGIGIMSDAELRSDLDYLDGVDCTSSSYLDGVRIVRLRQRGIDVVAGHLVVEGVARSAV